MGFLDKLRGKKEQVQKEIERKDEPPASSSSQEPTTGRKIKRYNSEGKPVYE